MRQKPLIPILLCILTAATAWNPSLARGAKVFPYKAYVTANDVYVRSGPGKNYYPTDKLREGQAVEIYRHDPGGWCAVRPPKGSFTWVATRYLRPVGDGLARLTKPRVAARVGSRFSPVKDTIQVRLHKDEVVEIVGRPREGDNPEWTRIAPPSGEFRWIHSRYLDPEYPTDGVRKRTDDDRRAPRSTELRDKGEHRVNRHDEPTFDEIPRDDDRRSSRGRSVPRKLTAEEFDKSLDQLNLELSLMVSEETTVWAFDELALEADRLLAQAETALERGRARMLLGKIERFDNIKQRYDAVNEMVAKNERRDRRLASLSPRNTRDTSSRFDGRGRLTRVYSRKPGTPRYALVDETGRITCYVTPSPGMNLRHYEQRTVGVNGTRQYIPEKRAPHVMAKHIDVIDGRQMR